MRKAGECNDGEELLHKGDGSINAAHRNVQPRRFLRFRIMLMIFFILNHAHGVRGRSGTWRARRLSAFVKKSSAT